MYATIHPIEPFDASIGTIINFTWNGNQIYKVRCVIKENESGTTVYDETISNMKQNFIMEDVSSYLANGTYYIAYITVFDIDDIESDSQEIGTPFYCFSTPTFELSLKDNDIIKASSYEVGLIYSQNEDEILDSFNITLYTYGKTVLQSSGNLYDTSSLSYLISGLENATQYYIRSTGSTLHGMNLDTGYILFTVSYNQAQVLMPLELTNLPEIGAIRINTNFTSTLGIEDHEVTYIDGTWADLRDNSVTYDIGFQVSGDFTMEFAISNPIRNMRIIGFTGDNLIGNIYYRIGSFSDSDGEKSYFVLMVKSSGVNYVLQSDYLEIPDDTKQFKIIVNRKGSYYDFKAIQESKDTKIETMNEETNTERGVY